MSAEICCRFTVFSARERLYRQIRVILTIILIYSLLKITVKL